MVPDTSEWQSSETYDFMDEVDADDLAWECLRRNIGYQKDYASAVGPKVTDRKTVGAIPNHWGLRFPGSAQPHRSRTNGILDARS